MATVNVVFRGDTLKGNITLRQQTDPNDPQSIKPYPVPTGAKIEIHFPAAASTSPVVLSTANAGEVTVLSAIDGQLTFKGAPAKSLLLAIGDKQGLDIVVTDTAGSGDVTTFEQLKVLTVKDRVNT